MRLAFGVEYKGSIYSGWQFQGHSTQTIQYYVQQAFSFVANEAVLVHASGRTDAGVHGLEQVCHFDTNAKRTEFSWRQGANTQLPADIRIKWVKHVDAEFHARYKALFRDYIYIIHQTPVPSALLGQIVTSWREPLCAAHMAAAAKALLGEHDFSAFRAAGCQASHPVRRLLEIDVWQQGDFLAVAVRGNAFLQHMVRNIVGTLLVIGSGRQEISWANTLLQAKDRTLAAPTAPANGLYFRTTHYSSRFEISSSLQTPFCLFDQLQASWPSEYQGIDFGDRL